MRHASIDKALRFMKTEPEAIEIHRLRAAGWMNQHSTADEMDECNSPSVKVINMLLFYLLQWLRNFLCCKMM